MKLDPNKQYLVADGKLLDDGTVSVSTVGGRELLRARDVEKLMSIPPQPNAETMRIFELVGTFTPDCKWKERP